MDDIDLWYTVPVCVEVRDGRVSRVVVDDEQLEQKSNYAGVPGEAKQRAAAYEAVDTMTWPAWEFGW